MTLKIKNGQVKHHPPIYTPLFVSHKQQAPFAWWEQ